MLDLNVLDVQKALRKYADYGHDVISDPQAVLLEGKPYRMSLGHRLDIGGAPTRGFISPDHCADTTKGLYEHPDGTIRCADCM